MCVCTTIMCTLTNESCLTCLQQVEAAGRARHSTQDEELQRLLVQHLHWQPEELQAETLPKQLCGCCYLQLQSFRQFQRQARDCRQQLLQLLQEQAEEEVKSETATFEIIYEETTLQASAEEAETELTPTEMETTPPDPFDPKLEENEPAPAAAAPPPPRRCKGVKNSHKCKQCGHCFAHTLTLEAHIRKVHEGSKRPFQCDRCEKAYSFMGGLYTHIKEIHGTQVRSYPCDHPGCDRVYISSIAMQKHKRIKHSPPLEAEGAALAARKYICEQCGASFNQSANLKYHRRTKHPTKAEAEANDHERYDCNICQKQFHSRYTLKYHTLQKHAAQLEVEQLHECKVCGRRMAKRFMLVQHMLMHNAEKMPCEHCGRLFARKFELEAHIRAVHLKLKPFACKYCAESFASRKTLRHHEYIHTGEKPYVCDICGQAFRQQTCLKNHGKVHDKMIAKR